MKPEDMKATNGKRNNIIFFGFLLALFIFLLVLGGTNGKIEEMNIYTLRDKALNGEIARIYTQEGNSKGKILLKTSTTDVKKFPSSADYWFVYNENANTILMQTVEEIRTFVADEANVTEPNYSTLKDLVENNMSTFWTQDEKAINIWTYLMPVLYIGLVLGVGLLFFRMLNKSNSKSAAFGKSKARVVEKSKIKFTDVAGIDEEKAELKEIVDFLKNPKKFIDIGARIPKGVLLVGPPGTGKTLLAKAIAGESNVPFFSISGSDFVEMFVGVGASRVRDLFEQAKQNMPCIVFIDEIDAVGRKRGAGLGGGNDEREQTLNQLLVQMDGFNANEGIIVVAATNRADVLDPALTRPGRFDRQIYVYPPDVKGREEILAVHARNKPLDAEVDLKVLARLTSGFTGADIENLLNEAAILTAKENRNKITMFDITEAIDKVTMGAQKKSRIITETDKRITAYHESGHAIVGKSLKNCDTVQEVSIIPRGGAAGYTLSRDENDNSHITRAKINDILSMMMGGRAAEQIVFEDITTGASNDIQRATDLARKMVTEWGMTEKLGFISFASEGDVFIGRDYQKQINYSDKMAAEIDAEVSNILAANFVRTVDILKEKRKILDEMVKVLIEKETIFLEEVNMIYEGKSAEEVIAEMNVKQSRDAEKQKQQRIESEISKLENAKNEKIKAAEALARVGILQQVELERIKKEAELKAQKDSELLTQDIKNKEEAKQPEEKQLTENADTKKPDSTKKADTDAKDENSTLEESKNAESGKVESGNPEHKDSDDTDKK